MHRKTRVRVSRRTVLKQAAGLGAGVLAGAFASHAAEAPYVELPKALVMSMLPRGLSDKKKFRMAKACGFQGIEVEPPGSLEKAVELKKAAQAADIAIHSVIYGGWQNPLSDPDPKTVESGLRALENALRCAGAMEAGTVLLVPAVVTENVTYQEAYERSQKNIRALLPLAEDLGVVIAVENVWNDFLLSPIEFAQYVDEFESPWLRAYFDVGNVVAFGWPQDWIRTLGSRIVKVHLKDFNRSTRKWKPLCEGSVNWPEVRRALAEVGFQGFMTAELRPGDEDYLRDVSNRMTRIAQGEGC